VYSYYNTNSRLILLNNIISNKGILHGSSSLVYIVNFDHVSLIGNQFRCQWQCLYLHTYQNGHEILVDDNTFSGIGTMSYSEQVYIYTYAPAGESSFSLQGNSFGDWNTDAYRAALHVTIQQSSTGSGTGSVELKGNKFGNISAGENHKICCMVFMNKEGNLHLFQSFRLYHGVKLWRSFESCQHCQHI
jgi:hypothetical protein